MEWPPNNNKNNVPSFAFEPPLGPRISLDGVHGRCCEWRRGQRCGGRWNWRGRCGLRQSIGCAGGAATSPTAWVAAPSGSPLTLALHAWFAGVMFGLNSTSIGYEPCRKRKGSSMVPLLTRDLSPLATDSRSWFVSHAQTTCFDAYGEGSTYNLWHGFALRFEPSPRARAHPSHCARSLRAVHIILHVHSQRAVAWRRDDRPDHHAVHGDNLAVRTHCTCRLHPKS